MVAMATELESLTAHTKPAPQKPTNPPPLEETVANVVEDIAKDAAFAAALDTEKAHVQSLINNLVAKVATNPKSTPKSPTSPPPPPTGVPTGDHRARRLQSPPLSWTQAADALTLSAPVPSWTRKQHVQVSFTTTALSVRVTRDNDTPVVFERTLAAPVDVDGCMWALEGVGSARRLTIELEKATPRWWPLLFEHDDASLYAIVDDTDRAEKPAPAEPEPAQTAAPVHAEESVDLTTGDDAMQTDADVSVDDTVADVVDDLMDAAVASLSDASDDETGITERATPSSQKVLTRADLPKMVEQYRATVEKGGAAASDAALQLATFCHHGIGMPRDDAEAARLYRFALENGALDPSAAFQLGLIYNQGAEGLEPDPREAVRWWRVAASLGNSVAMFNLGVMCMNGSGCEMDPVLATRWFQQAQALNPQLTPPQFSRAQLEERVAVAARLRKERIKQAMSPEERRRRKDAALQKVRTLGYGTAAIIGLSVSVIALRYWWRNRL